VPEASGTILLALPSLERHAVETMAESRTSAPGADRFLLGIVAGAVLLIVASVMLVLVVRQSPPPPPPDPSSPVGVVQAYIEALRAGDLDRARGYLTVEARASAVARNWPTYPASVNENLRIVVEPVREDTSTAEVRVALSRFSAQPGPFSSSTSRSELTVRLIREDGAWRINQPLEPYVFS
jgi:hypothetical protein